MRFTTIPGGPGRGHEMRCLAIRQEMERRGHEYLHPWDKGCDLQVVDPGEETLMHWSGVSCVGLDVLDKEWRAELDLHVVTGFAMPPIRDEVRNAPLSNSGYAYVSLGSGGRRIPEDVLATLADAKCLWRANYGEMTDEEHISAMASAGWVVSNGGLTMLEAMSMGKAVWSVPQTAAEWEFAFRAYDWGALLGLGRDIRSPSDRDIQSVGKLAREMVDGCGAELIVDLIEEKFA